MNNGDHLLRAILEEPHEDSHRLIYADWLEEHGHEERATFIRVQIELTHIGEVIGPDDKIWQRAGCQDDDQRERTIRGLIQILLKNDWSGFPEHLCPPAFCWDFRRGFVDRVKCPLADWLQHGPAIVLCQPVTEVRLTDRGPLVSSGQVIASHEGYIWWRTDVPSSTGDIPGDVWELLAGAREMWKMKWYTTLEGAHAALSRAAVSWARRQAGLPDLPTATP